MKWLSVLLLCSGCGLSPGDGGRTSASATEIRLVQNLRVGASDSSGSVLMNLPGVVDVDSAGWMYVTDWGDFIVRVLDPQGNHVMTLGRRGDGPGEFPAPPGVTFVDGDTASVFGQGALVYFDRRTGAYLGDLAMPDSYTYVRVLARADFEWTRMTMSSLVKGDIRSADAKREVPLRGQQFLYGLGGSVEPAWWLPQSLCAATPSVIYCGSTDGQPLTVYSHDLDSLGTINITFEARRINSQQSETIRSDYSRRRYPDLPIPRYWPAYDDVVADDRGHLWLTMHFVPGDSTTTIRVVDPTKETSTDVTLDGEVSIWTIRGGQAYGTHVDGRGLRTVVRYEVVRPDLIQG